MFASEPDERADICFVLWQSDRLRHFAIDRSVGSIQCPHQIIEIELAVELGSELFPIGRWRHEKASHRLDAIASVKRARTSKLGRARLPNGK